MGFDDIVRNGVALADSLTSSLQANVMHSQFTGQDGFGTSSFGAAVSRPAIVSQKQRLHVLSSGQTVMTKAKIMFLRPIPPNGAADRTEPIDTRDKIVLPDGTTGPIVDVVGLTDPETSRPYFATIFLGTG